MCVCAHVTDCWISHEVVKMTSRQKQFSFTSISHSILSSLSQRSIIDEKQGATWLSQQHSNRANPVSMVTREQITSNRWPNHVSNTTGPLRLAVSTIHKTHWKLCFFVVFFYLVGNMRLLTLPWCAVKRHFNLISLNNFLGYDALSFDCQGCLIIWFYIWEICNRVYFHFSQEHTWHHDVKTIFLGSLLLVIWLHLAAKVVFSVWIKAACERFSREHCHVFPWVNRTEPTRQISL